MSLTLTNQVPVGSIASVELATAVLEYDGSKVVLLLRLLDSSGALLSNATLVVTGAQANTFLANNKANIFTYLQSKYGAGVVT